MENHEMNSQHNDGAFSTTEMRRRYPKDNEGAKDEWRALIKHQTDLHEMIQRHERELKQLRQQELGNSYDNKLQDQIRAKEYELKMKMEEAQLVQLRTQQFKNDMMKQQEDKNLLQNHLADNYSSQIANKQFSNMTQREQQLELEKRMLEEAKRRMEEARRRELMKQEEYHNIFNDEIKRAEEKNQKLMEQKMKEKIDYRDNIRENERKQILKEENYRNFFKLSAENQKKLMDLHSQNVLVPQLHKDQQFSSVVEKRINEERERQLMDELSRRRNREEKTNDVSHFNKDKIEYKDYVKEVEKVEKQVQVQESLRQSLNYQEFLRNEKNQKLEQQKAYKDFLDRQQQEHLERERLNKMTKHEKKINFGDLQAYKGYDPKLFALVPGFLNSKYSHPLGGVEVQRSPKGNQNIYADTLARLQENQRSFDNSYPQNGNQSRDNSLSNSPVRSNNSLLNYASPMRDRADTDEIVMNTSPNYAGNNIFAGNQEKHTLPTSESYKTLMPSGVRGTHNPITNPLPLNVQNPYLLKEINKISHRRPYFANMASSNLVG